MTLSPGDRVAGKYRIESLLGRGGMGAVYVAVNERLHKRVALKVLVPEVATSPDIAARFTQEAVAASSVRHPGVVEIHDADVHDGQPWIAMELLDGESLAERLARGPMPADEAVGIVREALDALGAVHAAGIVHRDLKPDNIFLEKLPGGGRRVKVLDFGIAKILDSHIESRTQTGLAMGTPLFIAPEQATSSKHVDQRADIYGMGSVLFHALSGALPYEAETFGDLVRQMFTSGPRRLADVAPQVPPALAEVVDRCVAVEPSARPASAAEMSRQLEAALSGAESASGSAPGMPRTVALDAEALKRHVAAGASAPGIGTPPPSSHPSLGHSSQSHSSQSGFGRPPFPPHAPPQQAPTSRGGGGTVVAIVVGLLGLGVVALVGLGALFGAGFYLARSGETPPPEPIEEVRPVDEAAVGTALAADVERLRAEVPADAPRHGPGDALVTIVMWSDFQCPFCNRVEPTIAQLRQRYGPDLRVVWRDNPLPFHQNAMAAAEAAREARAQGGDAKFWEMHDLLFANQRALERADLERYAQQIGLDLGRFRSALDAHTHRAAIQADMAAAAELGARGTPAFFINGVNLMGAQPYTAFAERVDTELATARRLVDAGVPRDGVYARLMANARTSPAPTDPTPARTRPQPDPDAVYRVPVGEAPTLGPDDALVTIVAFSEFQCPFCNRVRPTLEQIRETYGRDVRIVFKHNPLPFHQNAEPAAHAAIEVQEQRGDAAFWRYHDVLFENQRELTRENLVRWARAERVDVGPAIDGQRHRARIEADQALARSVGATGTPNFFINGRNLRGAQPFSAFQQVIDAELVRARARVAAGTPRGEVYEALTRDGATEPQMLPAGR